MIDGGRRDGKIVASSLGFPLVYLVWPVLHLVKEDVMPTISPLACLHIALTALTSVGNSSVNQLLGVLLARMKNQGFSYIHLLIFDLLSIKNVCICIQKNTVSNNAVNSVVLSLVAMRKVTQIFSSGGNRKAEYFR